MVNRKEPEGIGILTYYFRNNNFGGILQAYALQCIVDEINGDCEQISYQLTSASFIKKIINIIKYQPLKTVVKTIQEKICAKISYYILGKKIRNQCAARRERFKNFEESIPHSAIVYGKDDIKFANKKYSTFIVGSDQVWNGGENFDVYCLSFVDNNKRKIAYAASAGMTFIGKLQFEQFKRYLQDFSAISVREKSLSDILSKSIGYSVTNVLDPVFLLSRKQWEEICIKPMITEPYILCYMLGRNKKQRTIAQEIANKKGCKLLTFPYITTGEFSFLDWHFGDIRDFSSGPREFIGLLSNAQAVITDSFHATAFSLIFGKNFCALPRYSEKPKSMANNRIIGLLEQFSLSDRLNDNIESILFFLQQGFDYKQVEALMSVFREDSLNWLRESLDYEEDQGRKEYGFEKE
ncbi:polysaccharide pyruvyl transferase family protein [Aminipila butyrica]|uniref:Polysaccharide pyruvyl transferase family protein n=1 Tax=Aminipila butyrica TaxID=433296 RepID=A0A858BT60_9FIRM|nr:polysaccharide pyruvyl transferase family protein [Aminipila butyrica]QIB69113.1 polysaccharide pyruvyl transferase family protein [Aminipila butyrica]